MGLNGDQDIGLYCKILAEHKISNAAAATAVTCSVGITGTAACKSFMTNEVYLCSYVTVLQARQHAATHVRAPITRHASCAAMLPAGIMLAAEKYLWFH